MYTKAVRAAHIYFRGQFHRDPEQADHLLYGLAAFPGDTPKPMTPHRLWVRIKDIGSRARAGEIIKRDLQFSPHLFRRTYATLLYKSGMGLKAIQAKTRHANIEVLAKHYISDDEPASPYFDKVLNI